jgi:hypothetical protein
MMLTFPELLTFTMPAIFLLRITAGLFFLSFGVRLFKVAIKIKGKSFSLKTLGVLYSFVKLAIGLFLTVGMYTQIASISGAFLSFIAIVQGKRAKLNKNEQQVQILLFVLCLSLIFLGPGIPAIDLPL